MHFCLSYSLTRAFPLSLDMGYPFLVENASCSKPGTTTRGSSHSRMVPVKWALGMWSQVGFRKHHYKQNYWRWWNSSWAFLNPKRWCCKSAALNMPANLENSAVATGLEKIRFHSNPKEGQCQIKFKLPHDCTHLQCWQSNTQNSPSQASTVHELWTSRCSSWI